MRLVILMLAMILLAACARSTVTRAPDRGAPASSPSSGATLTVGRGDTLYGLAFRHGVDWRDLARQNRIDAPYTIYPGQRLSLPGAASAPSRPQRQTRAPQRGSRVPTATPPRTATATPPRQPPASTQPPGTSPAKPPVVTPAPPSVVGSGDVSWAWPAEGQLVGRFAAGDPTRQGIDIAGSAGQSVTAAADGVVVYSGSGLVGYGELVIIKHSDVWLSAYGHNRKRLVDEGARVRSGQQIAEMGRSGASRDMLHFEIRKNGKPVDPLVHLPRR